MPPTVSAHSARVAIWSVFLGGAALSVAAALWVEYSGGLTSSNPELQQVFGSLAQMYVPPLGQISAYYWTEHHHERKPGTIDRGALLFSLLLITIATVAPGAIVFFVHDIEDSAVLLGTWAKVIGLTFISGGIAFFFSRTSSSASSVTTSPSGTTAPIHKT
jgi:hypothetical protein